MKQRKRPCQQEELDLDIEGFEPSFLDNKSSVSFGQSVKQGFVFAQAGFNQLQGDALNKAFADYSSSIKQISQSNQSLDVQQGFAAEAHHAGSFNIEARAQGNLNTTAHVTTGNDPVTDIYITEGGVIKSGYQSKYYKTAKDTGNALSQDRYKRVDKLAPTEQIDDIQTHTSRQAARNRETRPDVAQNYQDTTDRVTDRITSEDGKVSSTPLKRKGKDSSEELVREAQKSEDGPEYHRKKEVRQEFNAMQYKNAAKAGAISGAAFEGAAILLEAIRSDQPLTIEQCEEYAKRIVVSSAKGAGSALLVTGIQHAGQAMIDAAEKQAAKALGKTIGKQLVKGNVAAAVAQVTTHLAKDLYRFSQGEIDDLEFASSSIGGVVNIAGSSLAYTAGAGLATWIGAAIPACISEYAILGTTLGALGPVALGVVASVGFAMAAGAYVNHFSTKGRNIAINDLQSAMEQFNGGKIDFSCYTGKIASMSEFEFRWTDILPFSGTITVISEYKARKLQLQSIQASIRAQIAQLPEQERAAMQALAAQYNNAIASIDQRYIQARADITQQANQQIAGMRGELDRHLEMQYLLFTPKRRQYEEHAALLDIQQRRARQNKERAQAYKHELESLQSALASLAPAGKDDEQMQLAMQGIIQARMNELIPYKTGWDCALEFLQLQ